MIRVLMFFIILLTFESLLANGKTIDVRKNISDVAVEQRIEKIFSATNWYPNLKLQVKEGVVFLDGNFSTKEKKDWALNLLQRLQGVIAVVDNTELEIPESSAISPVRKELQGLADKVTRKSPYIISAVILLVIFLLLAYLTQKLLFKIMIHKNSNALLSQAVASTWAIFIVLIGLYLALRTSGLSGLAFTVLGGTGFLGIVIALALKGTVENYTSGLMISLRKLFRRGELVNIAGFEGVVQSVSTRGTTLMDYEGNNIIIPNAMIFESVIKNLTRNPNMRTDIVVGIGYLESIDKAKKIILETIKKYPDIFLTEPKPIITTDKLAAATVNIKIYVWFNAVKHTELKVKSLITQFVKESLMNANISLPDEAREVVFTTPLELSKTKAKAEPHVQAKKTTDEPKPTVDLKNEIEELKTQADKMQPVETGQDILEDK